MTRITKLVIIATVVLVVAYDVVALLHGGYQATISSVLLGWSMSYPIIPFAAGVLCGHLFFPQFTGSPSSSP